MTGGGSAPVAGCEEHARTPEQLVALARHPVEKAIALACALLQAFSQTPSPAGLSAVGPQCFRALVHAAEHPGTS